MSWLFQDDEVEPRGSDASLSQDSVTGECVIGNGLNLLDGVRVADRRVPRIRSHSDLETLLSVPPRRSQKRCWHRESPPSEPPVPRHTGRLPSELTVATPPINPCSPHYKHFQFYCTFGQVLGRPWASDLAMNVALRGEFG